MLVTGKQKGSMFLKGAGNNRKVDANDEERNRDGLRCSFFVWDTTTRNFMETKDCVLLENALVALLRQCLVSLQPTKEWGLMRS